MRRNFLIGLLVWTSLLTGCASVTLANIEKDARSKTFSVKPDMANIYVFRNEILGGAVSIGVELDGKPKGKTAAKTYFAFEVEPGKHHLISKAENDSVLDVEAVAGKNYFVWQEVKMGILYARNKLQLVDEQTGMEGVKDCKLIETEQNTPEAAHTEEEHPMDK
ncbi:MAG: DUF2846 domain-containing protein [Nitrospinae bacterium]|nr:DUF2846 domain-containing protein [Nitrospinota bacterium]